LLWGGTLAVQIDQDELIKKGAPVKGLKIFFAHVLWSLFGWTGLVRNPNGKKAAPTIATALQTAVRTITPRPVRVPWSRRPENRRATPGATTHNRTAVLPRERRRRKMRTHYAFA